MLLSVNSVFAMEVHDSMLYANTIMLINQTTDLLKNAREQVETLGGVKTIVDETKSNIYNMKNGLERSIGRLTDEARKLKESASAESMDKTISSLSSTDPADFQNSPNNKGIFYQDLKDLRNEGLENVGWYGQNEITEALKNTSDSLKKVSTALTKTNYRDFMKALDDIDRQEDIKNAKEQYGGKTLAEMHRQAEELYMDFNISENIERLEMLAQEINNPDAKDMVQMQQLSNILLHELIREIFKLRQGMNIVTYSASTYYARGLDRAVDFNDFNKVIQENTHQINDPYTDTGMDKRHNKLCNELKNDFKCSGEIRVIGN